MLAILLLGKTNIIPFPSLIYSLRIFPRNILKSNIFEFHFYDLEISVKHNQQGKK